MSRIKQKIKVEKKRSGIKAKVKPERKISGVKSGSKNEISYNGKTIKKIFPSGMYEFYSDSQGRFLKFDDLDDAKSTIDAESESMATGGGVDKFYSGGWTIPKEEIPKALAEQKPKITLDMIKKVFNEYEDRDGTSSPTELFKQTGIYPDNVREIFSYKKQGKSPKEVYVIFHPNEPRKKLLGVFNGGGSMATGGRFDITKDTILDEHGGKTIIGIAKGKHKGTYVFYTDGRIQGDEGEVVGPKREWLIAKKEELSQVKMETGGEVKYNKGGKTEDDYTKKLGMVEVIFSDPKYNYKTNVSGDTTEEQAREYFVGKQFNMGAYPKESMQKVIDIKFHPKGTYYEGGSMAFGGKVGGRGFFGLKKGKRITSPEELEVGDVILDHSDQFNADNTIKITDRRTYGTIVHVSGIYWNPITNKRIGDEEFGVAPELGGSKYYFPESKNISKGNWEVSVGDIYQVGDMQYKIIKGNSRDKVEYLTKWATEKEWDPNSGGSLSINNFAVKGLFNDKTRIYPTNKKSKKKK